MVLIPMLLSLTVHEWAHAWSAYRLGDDTASMQGRLTLNPIAHIDPIGTLILPLLGIPFGWAKPVPVNPTRFRRGVGMSTGSSPVPCRHHNRSDRQEDRIAVAPGSSALAASGSHP